MPRKAVTLSAWVSISTPREWGGIIGALQDNGNLEKGWILGYDASTFYFGLSTAGADDGNGKMTYLRAKTKYRLGKFYHLTAVYDGKSMELYVNGKKESQSEEQSGDLLYPDGPRYRGYQTPMNFIPTMGEYVKFRFGRRLSGMGGQGPPQRIPRHREMERGRTSFQVLSSPTCNSPPKLNRHGKPVCKLLR